MEGQKVGHFLAVGNMVEPSGNMGVTFSHFLLVHLVKVLGYGKALHKLAVCHTLQPIAGALITSV